MTKAELAGLTVMVTRPAHQAERLRQLIESRGGHVFLFPVLEILDPVDTAPALRVIARLEEYDMAVFISPNAVSKAMNLINARGGLPRGLKLATIGKGSARELRTFTGHDPDICPRGRFDSEALLELPELQSVAGQRIAIFRGEGGRELLADTLRARGASVTYVDVYRRARPQADLDALHKAWARDNIDIIAITSGEGLRNLFDIVGPLGQTWLRQSQLVVVNARLAGVAAELGIVPPPLVAEDASDEAVVDCIAQWRWARQAVPKESA